ncbi:hypothetical protein JCM16303_003266 [Sporobolomyces ruberrimus]
MGPTPATPNRTSTILQARTIETRSSLAPDPTKVSTHTSTSKLAVTRTGDPFKSSSNQSSNGVSVNTFNPSGWKHVDGLNVIVTARFHETKLLKFCSWLHMYEHARYLHAGLLQNQVNWPEYPARTKVDTPLLRDIHRYLSSLPQRVVVRQPDPSLETAFPEIESKEELQAAYHTGNIHFTGELSIIKDARDGQRKAVFTLCPPSAGMGSALFRRWGSDRFLRIKVQDDALRCCGPSFDRSEVPSNKRGQPTLREQLQDFFARPLYLFGRRYSPFCTKDGAVFYFAELGVGIEKKDERSLAQFAQEYLDARLNPRMTVAKYCARFELGLTTTTPTVTFPRHRVLRTPDLKSDSLKISIAMMDHIRSLFVKTFPRALQEFLPTSYLPSCIRGSYGSVADDKVTTPLVWQLDYTSPDTETRQFIHVHEFSSTPARINRPHFRFTSR